MLIEAVQGFQDYEHNKLWRKPGDRWEVTPERFAAINATRWGVLAKAVEQPDGEPAVEPDKQAVLDWLKSRPTKPELLAKAAELGIEVPKKATNPQIAKLIEEAL